ncbi:hypothetical protein QFC19_004201 [Naganishia cerealis]|uniref:Uncharacterized protein n=1 Tax=Naganishia cerealis TaxID=610337 RepID=A0ACC2VWZ0_9TREE|nr:hypothetical protein QFC19_004201 [Naganishia cerealis]
MGGTPHEVGYITHGDGRNLGEVPNPSESPIKIGSSKEKSSSSSASNSPIPTPSPEELVELKAIMKGEKQLSEDKTKRARQKELMKLMMAKKSEGRGEGSSSSGSAPSTSPLTPKPTAEELTELKDIMKGEKQFSEDKTKRARQTELMNLMMAKTSSKTDSPQSPSNNATPKKGVRFEDQEIAGASSKSSTASSLPEAATSASLESKSSSSRTGSSSRSGDPAAKSSSSGSSRGPSGNSSHRRDSQPAPNEPIVNDE